MCTMLRYNHPKRDSDNTEAGELRRTGRGRIGYSLYNLSDSVDIPNRKKKRPGQRTTADRGKEPPEQPRTGGTCIIADPPHK